ncbi:MAG: hypothetical protein AVO35_07020 [Candidatus Aegiribacteria sp. MLS_C]|nr:MAG: hypothetical protein AVO35_07020 [Candidatus Aegiribacteria sp. MLS_C]
MISLGDIAAATGGYVRPEDAGRPVLDCVIDSREAYEGSLFFALRGVHADGHDFVDRVVSMGGMAVVERDGGQAGTVLTGSVEKALLDAARWRRGRMGCRVVGITGSSGKTTTRRLLMAALGRRFSVYGTTGNLNNHIGLPLVVLNAPEEDPEVMVLEAGMNHPGELAVLGSVVRPTDCLITSIGRAHMEFFGSLEEVAAAKAELIRATAPGGNCVIPSGQEVLRRAAEDTGLDIGTFGQGGDVWPEPDPAGGFLLQPWGLGMELTLSGSHNMTNASAAALMAGTLGVPPEESLAAMSTVTPSAGRGRIVEAGGLVILDESYNANPDSTLACLEVLAGVKGPRGAVLGDMRELGTTAMDSHREVLRKADSIGLDFLIVTGEDYASVADEVTSLEVAIAADWRQALEMLRRVAGPSSTVLVKGSNSLRLGELVRSLEEGE